MICDQCGKKSDKVYWANLVKEFCSLECTNEYLEGEGFQPISGKGQSSKVKPEHL